VRTFTKQSNLTLVFFKKTTVTFYKVTEIDLCFVDEFMMEIRLYTN